MSEKNKNSLEKNQEDRKRLRTTVRFNRDQYEKITKDAEVLEKTVASLLKENYFSRLPVNILMSPENFNKFQRIYYGIANNCNQLTKRAHLGFAVPQKEVKLLSESNNRLYLLVSKLCGNGQD